MKRKLDRRAVLAEIAGASILLSGCAAAGPLPIGSPESLDLSDVEARHGGRLGIFAQDAINGRSAGWRGRERFAYCSTFKTFLAAALFEKVNAGAERLDRAVAILPSDIVPHAPVTEPAAGKTLTIEQLCRAVVLVSDNPAANILIRECGGIEAWRAWYRLIGDGVTRVDRLETELNSAESGDLRDTTTPEQSLANLRAVLGQGRMATVHRELLLRWMVETPTGAGRLRAGAPPGSVVAHKTGTGGNGATNDIGLVWLPGGHPVYVAAFFTEAPAASLAQREAVLAEAFRRAITRLGRAESA